MNSFSRLSFQSEYSDTKKNTVTETPDYTITYVLLLYRNNSFTLLEKDEIQLHPKYSDPSKDEPKMKLSFTVHRFVTKILINMELNKRKAA